MGTISRNILGRDGPRKNDLQLLEEGDSNLLKN